MEEKEIINLWKQGYTVDQILEKHPLTKKLKKEGQDTWFIKHRIEVAILNYQKGE